MYDMEFEDRITQPVTHDTQHDSRRARFAVVNAPSIALSAIDGAILPAAYEFVAQLHLVSQGGDAVLVALDKLNRVVSAASWTIYSAMTLPSALGSVPAVQFEMLASYPPQASSDTLHVAAAEHNEDAEDADGNDDDGDDDTLEASKPKVVSDESTPELQCARAAFAAAALVHERIEGRDLLALPLVFDARIVGILVGGRTDCEKFAASATWSEPDMRLLQTLCVPLAAWLAHRRQSAEAEQLLLTDDLTKMRNARYLREALISEIKRARRYNTQVSVLFLDLDNFKQINDEHGHLVGSHVLIEAAGAILGGVRNTDTVARYGGDEFVVLLPETTSERAEQVAERIRTRIAAHTFTGGRRRALRITASFGIASFPAHAQSPQQLIAAADAAMYRAKALNKNCLYTADAFTARRRVES